MQRSTLTLALTTLLIPSTLAKADTLNFSFHGESGEVPGQVIDETFSLPSSPTPYLSGTFGSKTGFYLEGVDVTGGGLGFESPTAELIFYTDGTIQLNETMDDPDPFLELFGDGTASFTGPVSAPTFHPGTYNILGTYDGKLRRRPGRPHRHRSIRLPRPRTLHLRPSWNRPRQCRVRHTPQAPPLLTDR